MTTYKITLDEFKDFFLPYIEEAKAICAKKQPNEPIKNIKISQKVDKTLTDEMRERYSDFCIEFTAGKTNGAITITVKDGAVLALDGSNAFSGLFGSHISNLFVDNKITIAFVEYLCKLHGEDYKQYVTDYYTKEKNAETENFNQAIGILKKNIEELEKKKAETLKGYDSILNGISNIVVEGYTV